MSPIEVDTKYTVQKNDTLSTIAQRAYNGSSEAGSKRIYDANKGVIGSDPTHIREGQELYIPPLTTGSSGPIQVGTYYTVQKDEPLSAIAQRAYNDRSEAAWKRIYDANKAVIGDDPKRTRIGQVLYIPRPTSIGSSGPIEPGTNYTVQKDDTLSAIAQRAYNDRSAWERIYNSNKRVIGYDLGNDPSVIRPGQVLYIPPLTTGSSSQIEVGTDYTVHRGEFLSQIAERAYNDGSKWQTIYHANKGVVGTDEDYIRIGQVLYIPPLTTGSSIHIEVGTNYNVQNKDETLSAIAERAYNDGSKWQRIYNFNKRVVGSDLGDNPDVICPGQVLYIPPIKTGSYTVKSGDTPSSIAQYFYGDSTLWPKIYDANKQVIGPNPDVIREGQVLKLPPID